MTGPKLALPFQMTWRCQTNLISDSSGLALKAKIHASSKGIKDKTIAEVHKLIGDCPGNR